MAGIFETRFKETDFSDLEKGQITEIFDANIWREMEPRARKVSSHVTLQLLLEDGRKVRTDGNLWTYKTTYLTKKVNKEDPKTKEKFIDEEAYEKLELYIQKIQDTNQMIAFEVRMPLRQDLTRFCTRLPVNRVRESTWSNPVYLAMIIYSIWINILQYLPTLGFVVDLADPFLLTINVSAITSIIWLLYTETKLEGYWATLFEIDQTRLITALDLTKEVLGRPTSTIRVRRTLTVYRVQIFYSEVMHTEALNYDKEGLHKMLDEEQKKKIQDQTAELKVKESEIKQLKAELNQAHTALEGSEARIRKAMRTGFVMRGKFEGEPLFQGENVVENILESGILKMALLGGAALLAMWIILPYLMTFEFPGLPEVSLMWQFIILGLLIFGSILIGAVVIIKAWKAT